MSKKSEIPVVTVAGSENPLEKDSDP